MMRQQSIDVANLFIPRSAIRREKKFLSGRKEVIEKALEEIEIPGTTLVFYGEAGVGKTTVAWQVYDILSGNTEIVDQIKLKAFEPRNPYQTVWIQCTRNMRSLEGALLSLFNRTPESETFADKFPDILEDKRFLRLTKTKYKLDFGIFSAETEFEKASSKSSKLIELEQESFKQRVNAFFTEYLALFKEIYPNAELVIFFDEVHQIQKGGGFGNLIKDTNAARFVIVGTMENLDQITRDNQSAIRKTAQILVPTLVQSEIDWIFTRAEKEYPERLSFAPQFRQEVYKYAYGFPYLVQNLGSYGTLAAISREKKDTLPIRVELRDFDMAIDRLMKSQSDLEMHGTIVKVIRSVDNNLAKEILYLLAEDNDSWQQAESVKQKLARRLRRHFDSEIESLEKKGVLRIDRQDDEPLIRFKSPLGRIFVLLDKRLRIS